MHQLKEKILTVSVTLLF